MNPFKGKASDKSGGGGSARADAPPAGPRVGVLVAVIDLGTQKQTPYQGAPRPPAREVFLVWELTGCQRPDGSKHVVGQRFRLSFHKKAALRQMLESWRGAPYAPEADVDLSRAVGRIACLLVTHKPASDDRLYVELGAVTPLMEGVNAQPAGYGDEQGKPFFWFIGCGKPIPEYPWLPWCYGSQVKDLIQVSPEWESVVAGVRAAMTPASNGNGAPRPAPQQPQPQPVHTLAGPDPVAPLGPNSHYQEIPF